MKGKFTTIHSNGWPTYKEFDRPVTLKELQAEVGGLIETVPHFEKFEGHVCVAFCNENGKLIGLPINIVATDLWLAQLGLPGLPDVLVGNVLIVQGDEEFMETL